MHFIFANEWIWSGFSLKLLLMAKLFCWYSVEILFSCFFSNATSCSSIINCSRCLKAEPKWWVVEMRNWLFHLWTHGQKTTMIKYWIFRCFFKIWNLNHSVIWQHIETCESTSWSVRSSEIMWTCILFVIWKLYIFHIYHMIALLTVVSFCYWL